MLTGIRGTGKTTTARIIAKGLKLHRGGTGRAGPTTDPCGGVLPELRRRSPRGRHVDVMEMDAASNTGVQNIRDAIIETVSYRAAQARYKIFIIDEVHMLSTSAFNALLKTLEEPPPHVKFLFRHHRNPQGSGDCPVALPALRPPPDRARGDDRPSAEGWRASRVRRSQRTRWR